MPRNNATNDPRADPLLDHKRYEKTKNLNAGAFGFVQLAKDKLNKGAYVAVKFIRRGEHINEYVEAEIINHRQLLHPHIIQFQEVRCCTAISLKHAGCLERSTEGMKKVDVYPRRDAGKM
jgi:serine/threonine protein kinase